MKIKFNMNTSAQLSDCQWNANLFIYCKITSEQEKDIFTYKRRKCLAVWLSVCQTAC